MGSSSIEGEIQRGKFYTFNVPHNPVSLRYVSQIIPKGVVIQTQFSQEEIEYIQRAREAGQHPEIRQIATETSRFRMLRVPYYGELSDRRKAFAMMQDAVWEVDAALDISIYSENVIGALETIKRNLFPFLPPERPPLRER